MHLSGSQFVRIVFALFSLALTSYSVPLDDQQGSFDDIPNNCSSCELGLSENPNEDQRLPDKFATAIVPNAQRENSSASPNLWRYSFQSPRLKPSWLTVSNQYKIIVNASDGRGPLQIPDKFIAPNGFDSPILLKTKLGILEGVRSVKFDKQLYTFLGVPYAKPPIDKLRFRAPEPIDSWDGVLQATRWAPFCVQSSMAASSNTWPVHLLGRNMSEDCLYLNIWTPSMKASGGAKRRPVMVWLHGGAFQYGGSAVDENEASSLAALGDLVVVTLNYRLSIFGFLNANDPNEAPNNVGLLDQRAALEWVQANIMQFGGDPQQVTLFGESAGGYSVGLHMVSPGSYNLFRRAILQSGIPSSFMRSYDANPDNGGRPVTGGIGSLLVARRLGCLEQTAPLTSVNGTSGSEGSGVDKDILAEPSESGEQDDDVPLIDRDVLECLRVKSSLELLLALGSPGNAAFFPTGSDRLGMFPDGNILKLIEAGEAKFGPQKDYMIGTNSNEGTFLLHYALPKFFPADGEPKVASMDELKSQLKAEIDRLSKEPAQLIWKENSQATSAKTGATGSGLAHLFKPLLRIESSLIENVMFRSQHERQLENKTTSGRVEWTRNAEFGRNLGGLITDMAFLCPAKGLANNLAEANRSVYFYQFSHRSSASNYASWFDSTHHEEVEFIFGRPLRRAHEISGADLEMSRRMMATWAHFAYTGRPTNQLGLEWPKYDATENKFMHLNSAEARIGKKYHEKVCDLYESFISAHL